MISLDKAIVIIPTFNEISNIEKMLETLHQMHPTLNVLIIDDGSPDGTAAVIKKFQQKKTSRIAGCFLFVTRSEDQSVVERCSLLFRCGALIRPGSRALRCFE